MTEEQLTSIEARAARLAEARRTRQAAPDDVRTALARDLILGVPIEADVAALVAEVRALRRFAEEDRQVIRKLQDMIIERG